MRKSYLALKVPVSRRAQWYKALRTTMEVKGIPVKWQPGYFHITAVFVDDNNHVPELQEAFAKVLTDRKAPSFVIDKLDAFLTGNGEQYIVHLASSCVPAELKSLIDELRAAAEATGANYSKKFLFHVTLGRIDASTADLKDVRNAIAEIPFPPFTVTIPEVNYFYHGNNWLINKWKLII